MISRWNNFVTKCTALKVQRLRSLIWIHQPSAEISFQLFSECSSEPIRWFYIQLLMLHAYQMMVSASTEFAANTNGSHVVCHCSFLGDHEDGRKLSVYLQRASAARWRLFTTLWEMWVTLACVVGPSATEKSTVTKHTVKIKEQERSVPPSLFWSTFEPIVGSNQ